MHAVNTAAALYALLEESLHKTTTAFKISLSSRDDTKIKYESYHVYRIKLCFYVDEYSLGKHRPPSLYWECYAF